MGKPLEPEEMEIDRMEMTSDGICLSTDAATSERDMQLWGVIHASSLT